ncbi:Conserved_hypothetical protein [Hexamita inflata]|uniref:Thioredoxin domain-containing protein n=1 Tax=Hexamita inflata TaxID=28002 RepID=A0AA86UXA4_9EUKA|nr:Conserved hypothetical protein [Hexamita inflata]CAI9968276.1 Conserved hypothetical protein [Hexamita inflata]
MLISLIVKSMQYMEVPTIKGGDLKKLEKGSQLSFAVIFTSKDCRTCEDAVDEMSDVYQELFEVLDIYQISCSKESNVATCEKYGATKFPMLKMFNHRGSTPVPAEYFGKYESDVIEQFLHERIRDPFAVAENAHALVDFMLTKALEGFHMFFMTPSKKPAEFLYKLGKQYFGKANIIVQVGLDEEQKKIYEQVNHFVGKFNPDEINAFAAVGGSLHFFPFPIDADEPEQVFQWAQELMEYFQNNAGKQQIADDEDDF